jgi:predicted SAM-dependent methyltransferase
VESARFQYGLQVKSGSLIQQNYPSNSFDAVTMRHVIEHIYEPLELLKECHRILKPGGSLVIETPNMESLSSRYFQDYWRGLEPPRHLHLFNLASLKSIAISAGFQIESLRSSSLGSASIYVEGINLTTSKKSSIMGIVKSQRLSAHVYSAIESTFLYLDRKAGTTLIVVCHK